MNIREAIAEIDDEIIIYEGFDDAIVGIMERFGNERYLVYDYDKCLQILEGQGMDREGAIEYFDFNVLGAWVGEKTPGFLARIETE